MASLPSQHPHLALHLTDRALTPIISSSSSSSSAAAASKTPSSKPTPSKRSKHHAPRFSTSPPSSDEDDRDSADEQPQEEEDEEPDEQSQALAHLTSTALASYDAAKRLERGAPLRTMVEFPGAEGPVVLHSYMCPMSMTLGVPGRRASNESLDTARGGGGGGATDEDRAGGAAGGTETTDAVGGNGTTTMTTTTHNNSNNNSSSQRDTPTHKFANLALHHIHDNNTTDDEDDDDNDTDDNDNSNGQESPNAPPMLIATVIAPKAEDLRDARRAAGRLERVAKVFQTQWLAVEGGGPSDGAGTGEGS